MSNVINSVEALLEKMQAMKEAQKKRGFANEGWISEDRMRHPRSACG